MLKRRSKRNSLANSAQNNRLKIISINRFNRLIIINIKIYHRKRVNNVITMGKLIGNLLFIFFIYLFSCLKFIFCYKYLGTLKYILNFKDVRIVKTVKQLFLHNEDFDF